MCTIPAMRRDRAHPYTHMLLATDLDGTFLGPHASLIQRNLEAVERFKAGGGFFTAATGRAQQDLQYLLPDVVHLLNAPAIMANGAYLYDFDNEVALMEHTMAPADVHAFVRFVQAFRPAVGLRIATSAGFLTDAENPHPTILRDLAGSHRKSYVTWLPVSEWPLDSVKLYKMTVRGEPEALVALRSLVEATFGDRFSYTSSGPAFFEIQASGCTKATGLTDLATYLSTHQSDGTGEPLLCVAAGNHENDLPMLEAADISGCPADALASLLPLCHMVLCPHTEGCVADLIDRLALL